MMTNTLKQKKGTIKLFDFLEKYLSNYYKDNRIAAINDIEAYFNNVSENSDVEEPVKQSKEILFNSHMLLIDAVFEEAINNYANVVPKQPSLFGDEYKIVPNGMLVTLQSADKIVYILESVVENFYHVIVKYTNRARWDHSTATSETLYKDYKIKV